MKLFTKAGIPAEFARFLIIGGINTTSTYLIYLAALWLGASPVLSYNISYVFGILISYLLNLKFTFRKMHTPRKMASFPLVYLAQYLIGLAALKFFLSLNIPAELAGLLIIPLTMPLTFFLSRFLLK